MNDELLLKLKNAGFPIQQTCGHCGEGYGADVEPTLSELIEACGKGFEYLHFDGKEWCCNNLAETDGTSKFIMTEGKSADEAVANLWLALHPSE